MDNVFERGRGGGGKGGEKKEERRGDREEKDLRPREQRGKEVKVNLEGVKRESK